MQNDVSLWVHLLMYAAFAAGAFYRLSDRAFHAKAGADQSIRTVWDYFQRESGWFLGRFSVAALFFIGTVHDLKIELLQGIVLGLSSGVGFEAAMDRIGSKKNGNGQAIVAGMLILALSLGIAGCPAKIRKDSATGKPYREPTVGEQLLALNVVLAQSNLSLQSGAIKAHELGLLPAGAAVEVVHATRRVAELDNELIPLLQAAAQGTPDLPALRLKIKAIAGALASMQVMQGLGIQNPASQRSFAADALLVQSLADQILGLVERLAPPARDKGAWNEIPLARQPGAEFAGHHPGGIGTAGRAAGAAA